MKTVFAFVAAFLMIGTVAMAEEKADKPTDAKVPTGYQVKGSTHYVLTDKGKVKQIKDPSKPGNPKFWDTVLPPSGGGE